MEFKKLSREGRSVKREENPILVTKDIWSIKEIEKIENQLSKMEVFLSF